MKFSYLIFAHKNPEQFVRLVKRLDTPDSLFFIHVDGKADIGPFKEIEKFVDAQKINWIKRYNIVWAGFNSIRATLEGFKAVRNSKENTGYLSFISAQDYPIKPVEDFHDFLRNAGGKSFMEYSPLPRANWANGGLERIGYYHIMFPSFRLAFPPVSYLKVKLPFVDGAKWTITRKIVKILPAAKKFPRKFIHDYKPYEGSNWFTLSFSLVNRMLKALEEDRSFYRFFKYTHHADEIFFQTLLLNKFPEEVQHIENRNMTYVHWDKSTGRPYSYTLEHFEELKNTDRFLARKFDTVSEEVMNRIDKEILNR
jgi:Core-2/I-Branching enzyme